MYFKEDTSNLNIIIIQEFFNIPSLNRNNYPTYKPDNIYQLINQHFLKSSRKLKKKLTSIKFCWPLILIKIAYKSHLTGGSLLSFLLLICLFFSFV